MRMHIGPGPVFAYEWLTASRRWQAYALRALFVALLLIGMAIVQADRPVHARARLTSLRDLAVIGEHLYKAIAAIELTLILLAAPAATAGAVCLDKARGTLDHMLATDLSNAEIVLGKLGVRLIPVLGLIACALPVMSLAGLLGGIDFAALVGLFLAATGCAVLACSLALTLSVYGRKTHEVLVMTYMLLLAWIMAPVLLEVVHQVLAGAPPPAATLDPWGILRDRLVRSNPFYLAYAPYNPSAMVDIEDDLAFLAGCLGVSAGLTALAIVRVRVVALRQAGRPAARPGRWIAGLLRLPSLLQWPGPPLDLNPVAWREWHRTRPSWMWRFAWGLYAALGLVWVWIAMRPSGGPPGPPTENVALMNMFQVTVGLVLLSVAAATSLAEERARGSLDVLLSTPMSTRSILAGKWWGSFRHVAKVAIWPAAITLLLAYDRGHWSCYFALLGLVLAHGAAITTLGLALATWVGRPGRAIALCVTINVLGMIGWPFAVSFSMGSTDTPTHVGMLMGDPPVGTLFGTVIVSSREDVPMIAGDPTRDQLLLAMAGWIVVISALSGLLFLATAATFDHCLGRIPDDALPRADARPGRSSMTTDELLALVAASSEGYDEGDPGPESAPASDGDD